MKISPSPSPLGFVEKNGVKSLSAMSEGMPLPLSAIIKHGGFELVEMEISPLLTMLSAAFFMMLTRTCSKRVVSILTIISSLQRLRDRTIFRIKQIFSIKALHLLIQLLRLTYSVIGVGIFTTFANRVMNLLNP